MPKTTRSKKTATKTGRTTRPTTQPTASTSAPPAQPPPPPPGGVHAQAYPPGYAYPPQAFAHPMLMVPQVDPNLLAYFAQHFANPDVQAQMRADPNATMAQAMATWQQYLAAQQQRALIEQQERAFIEQERARAEHQRQLIAHQERVLAEQLRQQMLAQQEAEAKRLLEEQERQHAAELQKKRIAEEALAQHRIVAAELERARLSQAAASTSAKPEPTVKPNPHAGWRVVYTDWLCLTGGTHAKPDTHASIGVFFDDEQLNKSMRIPGAQVAARAQLLAILHALENAPHDRTPLLIKTRSEYAVQALRDWLPGFVRNNWMTRDGKPVQNRSMLQYISALLNARGVFGQCVQLSLVPAADIDNADNEGMNSASYLAALANTDPAPRREPDWDALRRTVEDKENVLPPQPQNTTPGTGTGAGRKTMLESARRALERREAEKRIIIVDSDDDDDFELTVEQLASIDALEASQGLNQ